MKYFTIILLLLGIFAFTSCDKVTVEDELLSDKVERCDFIYPITFALPDGTTKTVDKWEDMDDKIKTDKAGDDKKGDDKAGDDKIGDDKAGDEKEAKLVFPVQFVAASGSIFDVNNYDELEVLWEGCKRAADKEVDQNDEKEDCTDCGG